MTMNLLKNLRSFFFILSPLFNTYCFTLLYSNQNNHRYYIMFLTKKQEMRRKKCGLSILPAKFSKKAAGIKGYTHIECYSKLSGKTLSEERFSSDGGAPLCHCVTSPRTAGSHPEPLFQRLLADFPSDRARKTKKAL